MTEYMYSETLYQARDQEMISTLDPKSDSEGSCSSRNKDSPLPAIPVNDYYSLDDLTKEPDAAREETIQAGWFYHNRWRILQLVVTVAALICSLVAGYYIGIAAEEDYYDQEIKFEKYCPCEPIDCVVVCKEVINGIWPNNPIGLATTGTTAWIYPDFSPDGVEVYCDCSYGADEAWTVFQRRMDGSVDFYRLWHSYVNGFGNLSGEFWLGLDLIKDFTNSGEYELRVDLQSWDSKEAYAQYSQFSIAGPSLNYALNVSGYAGDAGDSLELHNGMQFSTRDQDHDASNGTCAIRYHGAWWFKACYASHLNGEYLQQTKGILDQDEWNGIIWDHWLGSGNSLKSTEMKFRRKTIFHPTTDDSLIIVREPIDCVVVCEEVINGTWPNNPVGMATTGTTAWIYPDISPDGVEVYCDCSYGADEAWTVFQRRMNGSVDFYRLWYSYVNGFGNLSGEFWLGLDLIKDFTNSGEYELRVDLQSWDSEEAYAQYSQFSIAGPSLNYALNVSGYVGDAGDSLELHNGMKFSTRDQDHDASNGTCANGYHGAWWFKACYASHLNGEYLQQTKGILDEDDWNGIIWISWLGSGNSLKSTEMKFRRKNSYD